MQKWTLEHRDENLILTGAQCARARCDAPVEVALPENLLGADLGTVGKILGTLTGGALSSRQDMLDAFDGQEVELATREVCLDCAATPRRGDDAVEDVVTRSKLNRLLTAYRAHDAGRVSTILEELADDQEREGSHAGE